MSGTENPKNLPESTLRHAILPAIALTTHDAFHATDKGTPYNTTDLRYCRQASVPP